MIDGKKFGIKSDHLYLFIVVCFKYLRPIIFFLQKVIFRGRTILLLYIYFRFHNFFFLRIEMKYAFSSNQNCIFIHVYVYTVYKFAFYQEKIRFVIK